MNNIRKNAIAKKDTKGRGAPTGNSNAMKHGKYSGERVFSRGPGKLQKGLQYIEHAIMPFYHGLTKATAEQHGDVSVVHAAAINSACKWERHARLAQHWLRTEGADLAPEVKLKFSEAIAKASDARDRHIRLLGLDVEPELPDLNSYIVDGTIRGKEQ